MFYDNLQELCRRDETTLNFVVKRLGLSTGLPSFWKKGTIPKADTLQKLADYFHVTTDQLLNDLPEPRVEQGEEGVPVPILAEVGAGIPHSMIYTFDQSDPDSWEEISQREAHSGKYFALRIHGDSMEPLVRLGDVVIVQAGVDCGDGDYVIALIYDDTNCVMEGLCKRLKYKDGGIALLSENPDYPPRIFTAEDVRRGKVKIVGKCIERRGKM